MARKPPPLTKMERKQPTNNERSNDSDRNGSDRRGRARRSGEGSESALATLKHIERDRARALPADDDSADS